MTVNVITRFAPSPTGFLHLGGARTAIFNYLFSCVTKGKFLLRIDDTDLSRSKKEYTEQIIDSLTWLGLKWDNMGEEMYQSSRFDLYLQIAEDLIDSGKAYRCYVNDTDLVKDTIAGNISIKSDDLDDFIIIKRDKAAT
jgi:glutamyl-tRNA synthetase